MARIETVDRLLELIPDAAPLVAAKILDHLDDQALSFISNSPFLIMSTTGPSGLELSPKGDSPGFIVVEDQNTLLIPERAGNRLALGLRNIMKNERVGIAVFLPATWEILRIVGTAELDDDPFLCQKMAARDRAAILVIRIRVERAYFHCARSLRRAKLWDPSSWNAPTHISFGRIIARAVQRADLEQRVNDAVERSADEL